MSRRGRHSRQHGTRPRTDGPGDQPRGTTEDARGIGGVSGGASTQGASSPQAGATAGIAAPGGGPAGAPAGEARAAVAVATPGSEPGAASADAAVLTAPAGDRRGGATDRREAGDQRSDGEQRRDGGSGEPRRDGGSGEPRATCTTAQLRRFIKSRPWIPMHELRRRFGIAGDDDDVSPIRVGEHTLFIGLPPAEARLMGELLGSGDVGYELSLDPVTPVVVGVYPMRPVPRS